MGTPHSEYLFLAFLSCFIASSCNIKQNLANRTRTSMNARAGAASRQYQVWMKTTTKGYQHRHRQSLPLPTVRLRLRPIEQAYNSVDLQLPMKRLQKFCISRRPGWAINARASPFLGSKKRKPFTREKERKKKKEEVKGEKESSDSRHFGAVPPSSPANSWPTAPSPLSHAKQRPALFYPSVFLGQHSRLPDCLLRLFHLTENSSPVVAFEMVAGSGDMPKIVVKYNDEKKDFFFC
ncbi:hypothetical protein Ccrd_000470 [Cynara cardunculus var. scolymus]|uniref:Uncharacterized protein n=1 Tax=Cynara cardunculus var. scolymus TaxID=59895 RepID=A0A118JY50_CYNCS|nr:hypothetical protein Ccrd_000470 [Cynara cardunculus var. scolymus]